MTSDHPAWLTGAIDFHVHAAPSLVERAQPDLELGRDAIEAQMRGIVIKSHAFPTIDRIASVNRALDAPILHGGITLNGPVGGLNVDAVQAALELGAAVVWLPTVWAANHARRLRRAGQDRFLGIRLPRPEEMITVSDGEEVRTQVKAIIGLAAEHGATVATGHVSPREIEAVVRACRNVGVTPLVNHPFFPVTDLSIEQQVALAEQGAVMEYCAFAIDDTPDHSIPAVRDAIEQVGPDQAVLATDYGQRSNPAVPGLSDFAEAVFEAGLPRSTVRTCLTETPGRLLAQ